MVPITKEEKNLLKRKYPDLCIARTMRQDSKRKHYYCEERSGAMAYLDRIRQADVVYDAMYPNGKQQKQDDRRQSGYGNRRDAKSSQKRDGQYGKRSYDRNGGRS